MKGGSYGGRGQGPYGGTQTTSETCTLYTDSGYNLLLSVHPKATVYLLKNMTQFALVPQ